MLFASSIFDVIALWNFTFKSSDYLKQKVGGDSAKNSFYFFLSGPVSIATKAGDIRNDSRSRYGEPS